MKIKSILLLSFLIVCSCMLFSQKDDWVRVYGEERQNVVNEMIETYDQGYILGGYLYNSSGQQVTYSLIIKTDINGNVLWEKRIGAKPPPGKTGGANLKQTDDGGVIISGATLIYDNYYDAYIIKLNACGEKEWSRIFYNMGSTEFGVGIEVMDDGSYLTMFKYWGDDLANERIWLFNINTEGEIIWQKVYANWTLGTNSEEGYHLLKNSENEYLITGKYFHPNPGEDTNARWKRPMYIKIDSLGNEMWHLIWGADEFYYGLGAKSDFNTRNITYSAGQNLSHDINGNKPALFKLGTEGSQLYTKDIVEESKSGAATTISIMEDSILFIGATWQDFDDNIHVGILKTDTLGEIIAQKDILTTGNAFNSSIITHDNKYLVTGSFYVDHSWDIYLCKFNKNLEFDSIYTKPRVYDSLCPYPILSDTIDLDTTTVNLQELYKQMHRIKVHPNPASTKLFVNLGDLAKGDEIKLYNSNGQEVKRIPVLAYQKEYGINIEELPYGLYMVVLLNKQNAIDMKKVIISN